MAMKHPSLNHWRDYFRMADSDIFEIINHAILVAVVDCPKEFRLRRDRIAEQLFNCKQTRCSGCYRVELAVPEYEYESDRGCKSGYDGEDDRRCEFEAGGSKENKVNSSRDDLVEMNQIASNYSCGDFEALTDEIEEETQIVGEVLRIKDILQKSQDESDSSFMQSDSILIESLRKLHLLGLTVDTLQATGIGKAVSRFKKHRSKQISHLAKTLIAGWKEMVDEWASVTKVVAEGTPESVNPSVLDEEEGLPLPPLDDGFFFATTTMEFEQFFDGMDDDGNPRNCGEFSKNRDNDKRSSDDKKNVMKRKQQFPKEVNMIVNDNTTQQTKKKEAALKSNNKPLNADSVPGRPPRQITQQKANNEPKLQQKPDKISIQKKPLSRQQEKFKCSDEVAVQRKLESTKRKLQESYQQAENAKRQRTVQVMELHDLPKQGLGHRNPHIRSANHNRPSANGRR